MQADPDAGTDGGPVDAGASCNISDWHLENRPIDSVTPLFPAPSPYGTTEQLDVAVHLNSSCELLSSIEDTGYSGNATDFVGLVAHVWTHTGCSPNRTTTHRIYAINYWGNFRVSVADKGVDPPTPLMTYERETCSGTSDCSCGSGSTRGTTAEGMTCRTDCSCAAGLSCLCAVGVATAEPCVCARPCNDFLDCGAHEKCGASPVRSCAFGGSCPSGTCPDGYVCQQNDPLDNSCEDRRGDVGRTCGCDAECGAGELCLNTNVCRIPCWRDADCPANRGLSCINAICQLLE